jgi:hypothetical protein
VADDVQVYDMANVRDFMAIVQEIEAYLVVIYGCCL